MLRIITQATTWLTTRIVGKDGLCELSKRPYNSIVCCLNSGRLCRVSACHCIGIIGGGVVLVSGQ